MATAFFCMDGSADGVGLDGKAAKCIGVCVGCLDLLFRPRIMHPVAACDEVHRLFICHSMKLILRVLFD